MKKVWKKQKVEVLVGDCLESLKQISDNSIQCCITSPPYFNLRDYGTSDWEGGDSECDHSGEIEKLCRKEVGTEGDENKIFQQITTKRTKYKECPVCGATRVDKQVGLEKTPEEYVQKLVAVFREVRRVLRKDGVCWLNLGDSYVSSATGSLGNSTGAKYGFTGGHAHQTEATKRPDKTGFGIKEKNLIGIPWMVAFALRDDGWYLRQDCIWAKGVSGQKNIQNNVFEACLENGIDDETASRIAESVDPYVGNSMPESVKDRHSKSHEYVFMLTKNGRYFYDKEAVKENNKWEDHNRFGNKNEEARMRKLTGNMRVDASQDANRKGRNRRAVWTIPTKPYKEAHFAVFPRALVEPLILASTSEKGSCPDCGSPWERVKLEGRTEWKPTCKCYPRVGEWKKGTRKKKDETDEEYNERLEKITEINGELLSLWSDMETVPCKVLDCFGGSGTVAEVCVDNKKECILCELNEEYLPLIHKRVTGSN